MEKRVLWQKMHDLGLLPGVQDAIAHGHFVSDYAASAVRVAGLIFKNKYGEPDLRVINDHIWLIVEYLNSTEDLILSVIGDE